MIRLVVTDLDGTFWDEDMTVPADHLAAVEELSARGVALMVATSRRRRVVAEHLGRVGLAPAAVVLDGAMGVELGDGTRFHDAAFEVDDAVAVLALFRRHGLDPCVYVDEGEVDVVLSATPSTSAVHREYLGSIARTGDLAEAVAAPGVYGFSVTGRDQGELAPLSEELAAHGAEWMLLDEAKYGGWSLFVAPPSITKWSGIRAWCEPRGITAEEVLAVGDGDNDVEMLRAAGTGVGVRGGTPSAVASADHLVDGPGALGWPAILDLLG